MKTPSVVLDAFFPATITVAGLVLKHRFTIKHWLALEKIDSPLAKGGAPVDLLSAVKALYVVSLPTEDVFAKVLASDFEADALELAGRIPLAESAGIVRAVMAHINAGFVTARPANEAQGGEGEEPAPFASTSKRRGRAGSSRSSRKCAKRRST